jgi:hypothetical protein
MSDGSVKYRTYNCRSFACPIHAPVIKGRWFLRLKDVPWQVMLTITNVPSDLAVERKAWFLLQRWLKLKYGLKTYARVTERGTDTGMKHFHVLFHGTNFTAKTGRRWTIDHLEFSRKCEQFGFGKITYVSIVGYNKKSKRWKAPLKDVAHSVNYVLKYVTKNPAAMEKYERPITTSRDIATFQRVTAAHREVKARQGKVDSRSGVLESSHMVDNYDLPLWSDDWIKLYGTDSSQVKQYMGSYRIAQKYGKITASKDSRKFLHGVFWLLF